MKTFSGRRASQIESEITGMIDLFIAHDVKSYLEVGSREGDTFVDVIRATGASGTALDLPGGLWGKSTTRPQLETAIAYLQNEGYKVSCVFGDSQTEATRRIAKARGPYDAVLIDGDHTLAGCTADFDYFGSAEFGARLIAFHDIVGTSCKDRGTGSPVEVPVLWESLKRTHADRFDFHEFVAKGSLMGIGVMVRK